MVIKSSESEQDITCAKVGPALASRIQLILKLMKDSGIVSVKTSSTEDSQYGKSFKPTTITLDAATYGLYEIMS